MGDISVLRQPIDLPAIPINRVLADLPKLSYQERLKVLQLLNLPPAKYLEAGICLTSLKNRGDIIWLLGLTAWQVTLIGFSRLSISAQRQLTQKLNRIFWE